MLRKVIIPGVVIALILIAGAAIAGTTLGQQGRFSHIYVEAEGDSEVVAVVQGENITRGDIRKPAEFMNEANPALFPEQEALQHSVVAVVEDVLIQAEVERRGLVPTEEETSEYMKPMLEACASPEPHGRECRDYLEGKGYNLQEYWTTVAPREYRFVLGHLKLLRTVYKEQGISDAGTDEDVLVVKGNLTAKLRREATIVWKDEALKRVYEQALASD